MRDHRYPALIRRAFRGLVGTGGGNSFQLWADF